MAEPILIDIQKLCMQRCAQDAKQAVSSPPMTRDDLKEKIGKLLARLYEPIKNPQDVIVITNVPNSKTKSPIFKAFLTPKSFQLKQILPMQTTTYGIGFTTFELTMNGEPVDQSFAIQLIEKLEKIGKQLKTKEAHLSIIRRKEDSA